MKFFTTLSFFAGLSAASRLSSAAFRRDVTAQALTEKDLENGSSSNCPKAILIFARGSADLGNMGLLVGPDLQRGVEALVSDLWVQGVGGPYTAGLFDNQLPRGTKEEAIAEGVRLFELASTKCPNSAILAGGYSQGAALIAFAISDLSAAVRNKVNAAVFFGYTFNKQNAGTIPNYSTDRTKIFCEDDDAVCFGEVTINPLPHLSYGDDASGPGAAFLASKI